MHSSISSLTRKLFWLLWPAVQLDTRVKKDLLLYLLCNFVVITLIMPQTSARKRSGSHHLGVQSDHTKVLGPWQSVETVQALSHWLPNKVKIDAYALQILIGILASDIRLAIRSLQEYCAALKLQYVTPENRVGSHTVTAKDTNVVRTEHIACFQRHKNQWRFVFACKRCRADPNSLTLCCGVIKRGAAVSVLQQWSSSDQSFN